jgi:hypothetical protein
MKKKCLSSFSHLYKRNNNYVLNNKKIIVEGEIIKIDGIWGKRFKFKEHVVRTDNGKQWIDCYELERGVTCGLRSFYPERIKTIPIRKNRKRKSKM